jgi:hypothetical protein
MTALAISGRPSARRSTIATVGPVRTPKHLYYFNGAGPWPGATAVTDVLDKPALTNWKRRQVALAAVEHAERLVVDRKAGNTEAAVAFLMATRTSGDVAKDRGSRIHRVLEAIVRREPYTVEPDDMLAVDGARAWLNSHEIEPLEIESFLLNETEGYGGTCDLVALIDGVIWLLDWKTSSSVAFPDGKVYDDYRLQLAAYRHAEFIARPGDGERYPLPAIERCGVLHVTDGGTRLYEAVVIDDDWSAFRACLYLHQWKKAS